MLVATCGGGIAALIGAIGEHRLRRRTSPPTASEVFVNDLKAGQCLNGAGFATDEPVSGLEIVDCSSAHDVQVLDVNLLDSKEVRRLRLRRPRELRQGVQPGPLRRARRSCSTGVSYGLVAFTETGSPGIGDKVACLVKRADNEPIHEFLPEPPA